MKTTFYAALAGALLLAVPVLRAAEETATTATTTVQVTSTSWLNERGTLSTDDVVAALGVTITPEQREKIDAATAERNDELQKINARFSSVLGTTLAANDEELAKKVADERERERMDKIRRRQPGRYQGLKK